MTDSIFNNERNNHSISLDFESLRTHGIELIQEMAGKVWTDFNLHDPGVTILEHLCFALTDLAYQTDFDIADQLADKNGIIDYPANSFFLKGDILTGNPVTVLDYRKAIIDDVDEIDNVWLEPVIPGNDSNALKGLYKITVRADEASSRMLSDDETTVTKKDQLREIIKEKVRKSFCGRRSLCEDIFGDIILLEPVRITIHADIQIDSKIIPEQIMAQIYLALGKVINKRAKYLTESEMRQRGLSIDQIYCGPMLKYGFLPDSELGEREQMIDATNIIQKIAKTDGIVLIKNLQISRAKSEKAKKVLTLEKLEYAFLDIHKDAAPQNINLFIDKYRIPPIRKTFFLELLDKARETEYRDFARSFKREEPRIRGVFRDTSQYYSIQNYFPLVYGIGKEGLLNSVSAERKAQARQLKAYLMLFEQLLVNYLAQLDHVVTFFSNDVNKNDGQTYFANPLYNVPGVKDIIKAYSGGGTINDIEKWEEFKNDKNNSYMQALGSVIESDTVFNERKNRIMDHLLARFNELSITYPVKLYDRLYGAGDMPGRITHEISWKASFLSDFYQINYNRVRGDDYLKSIDDEYNFEKKMYKLLYITNDKKKLLTAHLDHKELKFDKATELRKESGKQQSNSYVNDTDWSPELEKIILSKDEVKELIESELLSGAESKHTDSFVFMDQDISVFRFAININNFRIGPDPYLDDDHLILYKAPADARWSIISRYSNKKKPTVGTLKKLIGYFKKISIQSEGFYLVEHVLLRPAVNSKSYGFKFYKGEHQVIFEHSELLTFAERDKVVSELLKITPGEGFYLARQNMELASAINGLYLTAENFVEIVDKSDQLLKRATSLLDTASIIEEQALKNPAGHHTPADMEHQIMAEENKMIAGQSKGIADRIVRMNNNLLQVIEKAIDSSTNIVLSPEEENTIRAGLNKAIKGYSEAVKDVLKEATEQNVKARDQFEKITALLLNRLSLLGKRTVNTGDVYSDLTELFNNIRIYGQDLYPKLKMIVCKENNNMVSEDFFNYHMSVIFPDWPARFQDANFKASVEGLFKLHAPVHIRTHIKWLNITQMKVFELLYSKWKHNLVKNKDQDGAWDLIAFLSDRTNNSYHRFKL